jgi:hypothetical protein
MNYEQKHQEDLEAAKGWLAIAKENNNTIAIQILKKFFPELKESEDEKIRKALLESFKYQQRESYTDKEWLNGIKLSEIVSWLEKQGEQKSWSKEDERLLNNMVIVIKDYYNKEDAQSLISWLKSLKDKMQPQPKQEWSEEDEEMLERCIDKMSITAPNLWKKEIDWLKSLKPNHWKLSEEQMEIVENLLAYEMPPRHKKIFESLYNDLKKL